MQNAWKSLQFKRIVVLFPKVSSIAFSITFELMSGLNAIFTVSGTITSSLEPFLVLVSICWFDYAKFGMLTLTACSFTLIGKLCPTL